MHAGRKPTRQAENRANATSRIATAILTGLNPFARAGSASTPLESASAGTRAEESFAIRRHHQPALVVRLNTREQHSGAGATLPLTRERRQTSTLGSRHVRTSNTRPC